MAMARQWHGNARLKAVSRQVTDNVDLFQLYPQSILIGYSRPTLNWIRVINCHIIGPTRLQCDWPEGYDSRQCRVYFEKESR